MKRESQREKADRMRAEGRGAPLVTSDQVVRRITLANTRKKPVSLAPVSLPPLDDDKDNGHG